MKEICLPYASYLTTEQYSIEMSEIKNAWLDTVDGFQDGWIDG